MNKISRCVATIVAAAFLAILFSSSGRSEPVPVSQVKIIPTFGVAFEVPPDLSKLLNRAGDLADALDEDRCSFIRAHNIDGEAEYVLHELAIYYRQARADGNTALANYIDWYGADLDDALYWFDEDCGGPALYHGIVLKLKGGFSRVKLPQRFYLGSYYNVGDHLRLYSPTRKSNGASIAGSAKIDLTGLLRPKLNFLGAEKIWTKFSFYYANTQGDESIGMIRPVMGNLLLPGPQGGASGFSLGGYPNNYVEGASYSNGLSKTGFKVGLGQTFKFSNSWSLNLSSSIGYGRIDFDEKFSGSLPLFNRDFTYSSDAKVDQIKLRLGLGLHKDFHLDRTTLSLGAYSSFGPDFSHGSGTDRLSFTGFPDSQANPSATKTSFGYGLGLSVGLKTPLGMTVGINGSYMRETGLPVFERDGTNPTQLKLESGDKWDANVYMSVPLNPRTAFPLSRGRLLSSDSRLKHDIKLLTRLANGIGIYRFRYLWSDQVYVGVMAQEVARIVPQAVARDPYGYLRVDYGRLGLRMQTWAEWRAAHPRQTASRQ